MFEIGIFSPRWILLMSKTYSFFFFVSSLLAKKIWQKLHVSLIFLLKKVLSFLLGRFEAASAKENVRPLKLVWDFKALESLLNGLKVFSFYMPFLGDFSRLFTQKPTYFWDCQEGLNKQLRVWTLRKSFLSKDLKWYTNAKRRQLRSNSQIVFVPNFCLHEIRRYPKNAMNVI